MKSKLVWGVKITSLLVVLVHFAFTFLYVMPLTPVKLEHHKFLNSFWGHLFYQDWRLFAPNPLATNDFLLVKCGSAGWVNITQPLLKDLQRNRLTPAGRLERVHGGAIRLFLKNTPGAENWRKACLTGDQQACKRFTDISNELASRGRKGLIKIGSGYCKAVNRRCYDFVFAHQASKNN